MDSQSVENKLQGCLCNTQQPTNEDKQNNEWDKNQYYFLSTSKQKNKKVSSTSTLNYKLGCRIKQWACKDDLKALKRSVNKRLSGEFPVKIILLQIHLITLCLYIKMS